MAVNETMRSDAAKVFGVGLNKTGTTTLGDCLKQFGFNHASYRPKLLLAYKAGDLVRIYKATDRFDSFEDWPFPLLYKEMLERYGSDAKFILTLRSSPEAWLKSLKSHAMATLPGRTLRELVYGYEYPQQNEQAHLDYYNKHNDDVRNWFAAQGAESQLLEVCWERGDGWPELSAFLGKECPEGAVPHKNKAKVRPKREVRNQRRLSRLIAGKPVHNHRRQA